MGESNEREFDSPEFVRTNGSKKSGIDF
jgi:hypothetical protein